LIECLFEDRGLLAEGPPHKGESDGRVVAQELVRDRNDLGSMRGVATERRAIVVSEWPHIGGNEIGALGGNDTEATTGKTVAE
jgi:hypothetical protein